MLSSINYHLSLVDTFDLGGLDGVSDAIGVASGGFAVAGDFLGGDNETLIVDAAVTVTPGSPDHVGLTPSLAELSNGNLVIAADDGLDIFFKIVDAAGNEVSASTGIGESGNDVLAPDVAGGLTGDRFVVVYVDNNGGENNVVDFDIRNNDGSASASGTVTALAGANDLSPSVASLTDGGFAVAWHRVVAGGTELRYAVYNSNGSVRLADTLLDGSGTINRNASVVALDTGGFAIAYENNSGGEGDIEISFARFGSGGAFVDTHNVFSNENDDTAPTTARLANGLIAVGAVNDSPLGAGSAIAIIDESGAMRTAITGHSAGNTSFVGVAGLSRGRVAQLYTDVNTEEVAARVFNVVRNQASDDQGDLMIGTDFIDQFSAGGGDDTLRGGLNADVLDGGSGNDTFEYDTSEVGVGEVINGGTGTDRIRVFSTISLLKASLASIERLDFSFDVAQTIIVSVLAEDFGDGLAADLRVSFGDTIMGHTLRVLMEDDVSLNLSRLQLGFFDPEDFSDGRLIKIQGDGDAERITGSSIRDDISGAGGNDILAGGGAPDALRGGTGNDFYTVDHQGEAIELANQGTDTVRSDIAYTLGDHVERLQLTGAASVAGRGNTLANILVGNDGSNSLNGGAGRDTLTGGAGADRFLFTTTLDPVANVDKITDFVAGLDGFRLDDAVFAGLAPGALAAEAFRIGTRATDASDRIIYNSETGALFFDPDGVGGAAQIRFASIAPGAALAATDFVII
jgi:hypothetical protein